MTAMNPLRVTVLGAGAWGTTLALVSHRAGAIVTLIPHRTADAEIMHATREHPRSLPGVHIPAAIRITAEVGGVGETDLVVLAVPTQKLRSALPTLPETLLGAPIVSAAKGIELETLRRPTEVIAEVLGRSDGRGICALSGPNLAGEIAAGLPAAAVVAGSDADAAAFVQRALGSSRFRLYTSADPIGVEMGGALKNIVAIGAGIAAGLHMGENAKAAFITRGLAEITRLGVALGADPLTFSGLSGVGDLLATCTSTQSRNYRVGLGLAEGRPLETILSEMGETAEGVTTTRAAYGLATRIGVEMPITEALHGVLFGGTDVASAIEGLLLRSPTGE